MYVSGSKLLFVSGSRFHHNSVGNATTAQSGAALWATEVRGSPGGWYSQSLPARNGGVGHRGKGRPSSWM